MTQTPESAIAELFLKPLLFSEEDNNKLMNKQYLGIYYQDTNKPQWEDKIIIAYNYNGPLWQVNEVFEKSDYAYQTYTETIDNNIYKIYSFIVPPQIKKDFEAIINGDYSKISIQTISKIQSFWKLKTLCDKIEDYHTGNKTRFRIHYSIKNKAILDLNHMLM